MSAIPLTNWDWLVALLALVSGGFGVWSGAIRTVFGLAAWVFGVLAAPLVGGLLGSRFDLTQWPIWVLYVIAFLVTFVVVRFAGFLVLKGVQSVGLGGVDRVFGGVLGLARAGLLLLVCAVIAHRLGFAQSPAWRNAISRPLLDIMVQVAEPWLPAKPDAKPSNPPRSAPVPGQKPGPKPPTRSSSHPWSNSTSASSGTSVLASIAIRHRPATGLETRPNR